MNTIILRYKNSSVISKFFLFLILAIIPAALFAQDVSIDDFRIPTSKYQRFLGGLSGGWDKSDNDNYDPIYSNQFSDSRQTSTFYTSLGYMLGDFSENRSLEIAVGLDGNGQYGKSNSSWIDQNNNNKSKSIQKTYSLYFVPSIRYSNYITPDLWHWFIEGSGSYSFNEHKMHSEQSNNNVITNDSLYYKDNNWDASVGGGIGYGKMRDGSSVFAVLRILDKLREDSLLIRSLTKEETLRLVGILARINEYAYIQDRYVKLLMEDLFAALQKMGVLKNNTSTSYSVLRAVEVLSEWIEPRLFGWRVRLGFQRSFYEQIQVDPYGYYNSYTWSSQDMLWLGFDYGCPVSLNLHIISNFLMSAPRLDYQRKTNFSFNAKGIYQIGERIDATMSGSFYRNQRLNGVAEDPDIFTRLTRYTIGTSFRFFIENNIYFSIGGEYVFFQYYQYTHNGIRKSYNEGPSISFGVNYRFI